jgi:hypothetical protein
MIQILSTEYLSLMIVTKNGDLKVAFVEASDNLWAPKASYEINCSILVLMKACVWIFGVCFACHKFVPLL